MKKSNEIKLRPVNCPVCKKKFNYYQSEARPFCTPRCKDVDLGHWITGSYSVEGAEASPEAIVEAMSEQKLSKD